MSNSTANAPTTILGKDITVKQQDMYTMGLPKDLRDYLKFEAPVDWCPRFVYGLYRKHGKGLTLTILRNAAKEDTEAVYGSTHPELRSNVHANF